MIRAFRFDNNHILQTEEPIDTLKANSWFDLIEPTQEEDNRIEAVCGISIPTRDEMAEIEISSRLYQEDGAVFMTALVLANVDHGNFTLEPVSFILTGSNLVTVRYHVPKAFELFTSRALREASGCGTNASALVMLLEAVVDRAADVLERTAREIDGLSARIFGLRDAEKAKGPAFERVLVDLGKMGDLTSAIRDSLISLDRVGGFLALSLPAYDKDKALKERLKTLNRDIRSISDHTGFLSQKVTFLLDATLGLINIEQNNIIKIFSIAAVVLLPPTLVASAYGMNFAHMPELEWTLGYPMAIGLMVISALIPFWYFKRKGWL
jgi:magnesium transporter